MATVVRYSNRSGDEMLRRGGHDKPSKINCPGPPRSSYEGLAGSRGILSPNNPKYYFQPAVRFLRQLAARVIRGRWILAIFLQGVCGAQGKRIPIYSLNNIYQFSQLTHGKFMRPAPYLQGTSEQPPEQQQRAKAVAQAPESASQYGESQVEANAESCS